MSISRKMMAAAAKTAGSKTAGKAGSKTAAWLAGKAALAARGSKTASSTNPNYSSLFRIKK
jgi:hypothetical protein